MKKNNIAKLLTEANRTTDGNVNSSNEIARKAALAASKNPRDPNLRILANKTAMDAKHTSLNRTISQRDETLETAAHTDPTAGKTDVLTKEKVTEASDVMIAQINRNIDQKNDALARLHAAEEKHDDGIEKKEATIEAQKKALQQKKELLQGSSKDEGREATTMAEATLTDPKEEKEDVDLSQPGLQADPENLTKDEKKEKK